MHRTLLCSYTPSSSTSSLSTLQHVGRNIVSLLNADGGILAYGVRPNGIIYGEEISRREQDMLNHTTIDETVKRIIPNVDVEMYRVTYTDVNMPAEVGGALPRRRQVLEIRVAPGSPYQLYEDQNHEVRVSDSDGS